MTRRNEQEARRANGTGLDGLGLQGDAQSLSGAVATAPMVRVVVAGKVQTVTPLRAARLLTAREAELPEDVTIAEAQAILAAEDVRQAVSVRTLRLEMSNRGADMPDRFGGRMSTPGILSGWR